MRSLETYLIDLGVDLAGWHLDSALAISADGTTVVGYGNPSDSPPLGWHASMRSQNRPRTR